MIPRPTDPMHDPLDLIDAAPEIPACDGCQGEPAGQTLALDNWQQHMAERRKQQEYMSRALQKPVTELIMNKSENYRRIQEERHLIDRSLPRMLNGKGYRVGSEFWNQPRHMGDELCGITMTLTQTEQGYPEPLARIGQPLCVRSETGSVSPSRHHTWEKSSYLQRRREDLKSVLKDLDLSQPDFDGLEVLGSGFPLTSVSVEHYPLTEEMEDENEKENTDPLQDYPDVMMEPILGPSLLIGGKRAQWTGNASSHEGEVGITARLTFEALAEMPATSSLDVTNNGSASVYFSWKRLPHVVSFEDIQGGQKTQRFYFDTGSGVILPGDKQQFLFTFKSPNAGIFSETWELSTHPTLLGGAGIQVTLRGIALHDDRTAEMRQTIQVVLSAKLEDQAWQEEALAEMNRLVLEMSRPPYRPRADLLHHVGLQLWRETIDGMDTQAASLRHLLGITEGDTWALDLQDDIYGDWENKRLSLASSADNSRGTKLKKGSTQKEDKKGAVMKEKEEKKPAGKPGAKERQLEERPPSKKGKQKEEKKAIRGPMAVGKEATSSSDSFDSERSDGSPVDPVLQDTYRRELHIRVVKMTTSALRRQVKNIVHNYSEAEIKVREATSNDPWGPSSSLMSEIADLTFNMVAFTEVMGMIWKRLNDHGKNWRHVYKALTLLDYLIKTGSDKVTQQCKENLVTIQTLRDFQYIDRDGKDQGINVREKAKQLVALIRDEERLRQERGHALKTKERMSTMAMSIGGGGGSGGHTSYPSRRSSQPTMSSLYGEEFGRSRGSPSSYNSSSSSPRFISELEQSRPQTTGEEELQLQLALAMSREECGKGSVEVDEDTQLQIALSLSKEQHKKSSLIDLVDVFGPVSSSSASGDPWDVPSTKGLDLISDPWTNSQKVSSPALSLSAPDPWAIDGRKGNRYPLISSKYDNGIMWCFLGGSIIDPFAKLPDLKEEGNDKDADSVQSEQYFDEPGPLRSLDRPAVFEEMLDTDVRNCRTPESFLDPSAASLVNLESLIPTSGSLAAKNKNPFLSGLAAPSASNPFQSERPRLTLNQMRTPSSSLQPGSMSYSASLPLPLSSLPAAMIIPSSFTQLPAPGVAGFNAPLNSRGAPLVPLGGTPPSQQMLGGYGQNPFL
ncbi:EPN3 protein, partial [Polypterus senegalus]